MQIWVMEDGEKKQEWSKVFSCVMKGFEEWRIMGVISGGEIVFINRLRYSFSHDRHAVVLYYDPNHNYRRYVDIKGAYPEEIRKQRIVFTSIIPDNVENTMCLN